MTLYVLAADGRVTLCRAIEASQPEAEAIAERHLEGAAGVELWHGPVCVYRRSRG